MISLLLAIAMTTGPAPPIVDDTEPYVKLLISRQLERNVYMGVVSFTRTRVVVDGREVSGFIGPVSQPFVPQDACTEVNKCEEAGALICKLAGQGGIQTLSAKLVDGHCEFVCSTGTKGIAICLGPK